MSAPNKAAASCTIEAFAQYEYADTNARPVVAAAGAIALHADQGLCIAIFASSFLFFIKKSAVEFSHAGAKLLHI